MRGRTSRDPFYAVALILGAVVSTFASAETTLIARPPLPADLPVRTVVAGEQYGASEVRQFFLGTEYRPLWLAPIDVPELNLQRVAGGLKPVRRTSGKETIGLVMKGADGREYRFRSLDKDPSKILPDEYHETFVDDLVQDQIAATLPGGTVVVSPILRAAGVLHVEPVIVVMPDDPSLGEFRSVFAGLVGTFEEHPEGDAHTFGAVDIMSGEKMWERMDKDPDVQPDARAFLRARLVDILVGDFDRHRDQWRWAKMPGHQAWQPIPEDRDQAFIQFEGLVPGLGHLHAKRFVSFDKHYPHVEDITFNGRDGDRRILVNLEKSDWDEIANDVTRSISDTVIAEAVASMPRAYREIQGATLAARLRSRRDELPAFADEFYRFLARDVDLRGTKQNDVATIDHHDNGDVDVAISIRGDSAPYRHRLFHPAETEEVRIYLLGGADSVVTTGGHSKIIVRVIGGDGDDLIDDRAGTRLKIYDASGDNKVLRGNGTSLSTRSYTPPERETAEWIPPRDWGGVRRFFPFVGGDSDVGVLFLAGVRRQSFGFRKDPWANRQRLRVQYGTAPDVGAADYRGEFRHENSGRLTRLSASASMLDFLHFYGFGNETRAPEIDDHYDARVAEYVLEPALVWELGGQSFLIVSARGQYTHTNTGANLLTETGPLYGSGDFFQAGPVVGVTIDRRNPDTTPMQGLRAHLSCAVFPPLASVASTFGEVHGEVSYSHPIISALTVAARAGGKHVLGDTPYYEAAYLGGASTLRGFPSQRFAGDSAVFGSAELRVPLTPGDFLPKGSLGVFALCDVGRVFLDGESSDRWHVAGGGGLWLARPGANNALSVSIAAGDEGTRLYVGSGFIF